MACEPAAPACLPTVGVFDSGVGGLSVLRSLRETLPGARFIYVADSGHAPYGEKPADVVLARARHIVQCLRAREVDLVVVACNTATAVAIETLRREHPLLPFVGVEPGVKPAMRLTRNGRIGVMATPATLASERFAALVARLDAPVQVHAEPCAGLAAAIEAGVLDAPAIEVALDRACDALRRAEVDTVVLGCTHYPFVAGGIARRMGPRVTLVDTAEAIARRTLALLGPAALQMSPQGPLPVQALTSGSCEALRAFARAWLAFGLEVSALD
jgi:glutamate racemase